MLSATRGLRVEPILIFDSLWCGPCCIIVCNVGHKYMYIDTLRRANCTAMSTKRHKNTAQRTVSYRLNAVVSTVVTVMANVHTISDTGYCR